MAVSLMHCNQVKSVSELTAFICTNTCIFPFFRLCHRDGANNVSISALARKHSVPKVTLWKQITGRVLGAGHQSGSKEKGHVLTPSEYYKLLFWCWVLFSDSAHFT